MKALIIGATGATGKDLVDVLLEDPACTGVVAFVRRSGTLTHPKYTEVITDFEKLEEVAGSITGGAWFSCLGTTMKVAGTKEKQWHVDHDIPLAFARIARRNGVPVAVILSAHGADANSKVFYSRLKGTLDEAVIQLGFPSTLIFRPGVLLRKDTDRPSERIIVSGLKFMNALGLLEQFRPLPTSTLAARMAAEVKTSMPETYFFGLGEISGT